jgi:hypothetical protein
MKTNFFFGRRRIAGFTVAEAVVSLGIGAVAMLGGMTLSQHELRLVKSVRESNAASHALEERIEQLRLVNWRQMIDSEFLMTNYFPKRPASGRALPDVIERVSVTAFPDPRACSPLIIESDETGKPYLVSSGTGFDKQRLARVNVRVNWIGADGKERIRELASIISNAGINATSLPAMGADGTDSGATSTTSTTTSGTTTQTGTTTTSGTTTSTTDASTTTSTSPSTTTTTTTTTTSTRGRGNVAGKTGKK